MSTIRPLALLALAAAVVGGSGCRLDIDGQAYIEREEKRFAVADAASTADVNVKTFDGAIEVRSWDRPEVLVEIEKRGQDKDAVGTIDIVSEQKGSAISVDVRHTGRSRFTGIGRFTSTTARLIVSLPRKCNFTARSGDGSITLEHVEGKLDLFTDDGAIRVLDGRGELLAETRDGSLTLDDVTGRVEGRTNDGSVRISGTPTVLKVRTGDGSISLRIRDGASMADDWTATTNDGGITVELPSGFNAMIDANPGSDGHVRNDLRLNNAVGAGASGSGRSERGTLTGQLGNGGRQLTLRTGDGTIRITNY